MRTTEACMGALHVRELADGDAVMAQHRLAPPLVGHFRKDVQLGKGGEVSSSLLPSVAQ